MHAEQLTKIIQDLIGANMIVHDDPIKQNTDYLARKQTSLKNWLQIHAIDHDELYETTHKEERK
jgi:hypothetical protein